MKFVELREKLESPIEELILFKRDGEFDEEIHINLNESSLSKEELLLREIIGQDIFLGFNEELVDFIEVKNGALAVQLEYSDAAYSSLEHLAQKLRIPVHTEKYI